MKGVHTQLNCMSFLSYANGSASTHPLQSENLRRDFLVGGGGVLICCLGKKFLGYRRTGRPGGVHHGLRRVYKHKEVQN